MKIIFYYDNRSVNDATLYYIKLVEQASKEVGLNMYYTTKLENVQKNDIIFTITGNYFCIAKIRYPFHKTMYWSQGVGPEEYLMRPNSNRFKFLIKNFVDFLAINYSNLLFLISDKLLEHYNFRYSYSKDNYMIIPCYNLNHISGISMLNKERYNTSSFVYAGNMASWQCIEETLQIYRDIENCLPNATLTLLTEEKVIAEALIEKYNLKNVKVKYVQLSNLQDELSKYKYGFLIREDTIVNNIATPTKMNSYLASGIIPIYTDAVDSFVANIKLKEYTICLNSKDTIAEKAQAILNFDENIKINPEILDESIATIFKNYYNDDLYLKEIKSKIKSRILKTD